jgi:hypothetical protein
VEVDMTGDRPAPPTRFVIWFNQRSGSSLLQDLLNSHEHIFCAPELWYGIEKFGRPDAFVRSGCTSLEEFLDLLCTPRSDPAFWERIEHPQLSIERAVGLKVKYEQAITYPAIQAFHASGLRVIHLLRNPLAVYASSVNLQRVKDLAGDVNLPADRPLDAPLQVRLDPELAIWEVHRIHQAQEFGRFVCRTLRTLELRYEDLVADQQLGLRQALGFLGVPYQEMSTGLTKALPSSLEETIENFGEVHDALSRTELAPLVF